MSDTIALYEKQKAIDAAKAQEKAMKDAEEQRRQAEKDTRKNEFLQALQTVEALEMCIRDRVYPWKQTTARSEPGHGKNVP